MPAIEVQRDLRHTQTMRGNWWQAAIASLFFVVVIGASLFLGALMMIGTLHRQNSDELTADGRTARIARSLNDGSLCHFIVFDNKTAQAVEDRIGRCDETTAKPKREQPQTFSWGRR
jgi:hypothetical protein